MRYGWMRVVVVVWQRLCAAREQTLLLRMQSFPRLKARRRRTLCRASESQMRCLAGARPTKSRITPGRLPHLGGTVLGLDAYSYTALDTVLTLL